MVKGVCPPAGVTLDEVAKVVRLKPPTFAPSEAALVVLDLQKTFTEPGSHAFVPSAPEVVKKVNRLAEAFSERSLPVLYTLHEEANPAAKRWWRDEIRGDSLDPGLKPLGPVFVKGSYDPFLNPKFAQALEGRAGVVITGVMTHICVTATALSAFSRGMGVIIPVDAVASYNPELHLSALKVLAHACAALSTVDEVLRWLRSA